MSFDFAQFYLYAKDGPTFISKNSEISRVCCFLINSRQQTILSAAPTVLSALEKAWRIKPSRHEGIHYYVSGRRIKRLHYNRYCYYDPEIAAYISQDTIGLADGENIYAYMSSPNTWDDPLGLKCWSATRRDYWKAEAKAAPKGIYSPENMLRMRLGLAPEIRVEEFHFRTRRVRIRNVSLELNHRIWPQRSGKNVDIPYNLEKVTLWEHAAKDPYRHTGSRLIKIIQNVGNYKGY